MALIRFQIVPRLRSLCSFLDWLLYNFQSNVLTCTHWKQEQTDVLLFWLRNEAILHEQGTKMLVTPLNKHTDSLSLFYRIQDLLRDQISPSVVLINISKGLKKVDSWQGVMKAKSKCRIDSQWKFVCFPSAPTWAHTVTLGVSSFRYLGSWRRRTKRGGEAAAAGGGGCWLHFHSHSSLRAIKSFTAQCLLDCGRKVLKNPKIWTLWENTINIAVFLTSQIMNSHDSQSIS